MKDDLIVFKSMDISVVLDFKLFLYMEGGREYASPSLL